MKLPTAKAAALARAAAHGHHPTQGNNDPNHVALRELCARRDRGDILPAAEQPLDLSGVRFVEVDFSGLDLSGIDFSNAELLSCNFAGARLVGANLTNALLHNVNLTDVELLGSTISGADFTNGVLDRAGFGQAVGVGALFFGAKCTGTTFTGADLTGSDFRAAKLEQARMLGANLTDSVFASAMLADVDLTGAALANSTFRDADMRGAQLRNVTGYTSADWINADIQNVDFTGAWLVRRHIQDENYIHEFRTQSPTHERLYKLWSITSDCGRSLSRWSLWTVLVAMIYAGLYTQVDIDWGDYETPISPIYYSVVTFTTLGYGDVLPGSTGAQMLAMSEVIFGYFSLGGMMSILSDKMARRAG
ncbi:MAG: pentapeptide repeat-containing protein [Acidimicrobiales bacterium]